MSQRSALQIYNKNQAQPNACLLGIWFYGRKNIRKFSIFINAENLTDERPKQIQAGGKPTQQPRLFDDIWNHTEGRIFNGSVKIINLFKI